MVKLIYIPKEGIPQKDRKILEEIKYMENKFFTYDDPVPFCGLNIYPVTVRDYNNFLILSDCFLLNKNDDPNGISKTHLDYLLEKLKNGEDGPLWSFKFCKLLEMIFHLQDGLKCEKCNKIISYEEYFKMIDEFNKKQRSSADCECGGKLQYIIRYGTEEKTKRKKLIIDGHEISSKDFNLLRRIPLYQNMPDYHDDSWVHPEIRADQAKRQEILAKKEGPNQANLERKIICVAAKSNYKIDEIYNLPMRKFIMLLGVIDDAITYETTRIGLMTGMVSAKGPIDHWVYKKEKGMYGAATDAEDYVGKIKSINGG